MVKLQARVARLKAINMAQLAEEPIPKEDKTKKVEIVQKNVYQLPGQDKDANKSNIISTFDDIKGKRETNKQYVFMEQLQFEGKNEKDLLIRQEFYKLRGDHGIEKTNVELILEQQQEDLEQKIRNKKQERIANKAVDTHSYFISKENAEAAERARRLKKR